MDSIKEEINGKINRGDDFVRIEGIALIGKKSGPRRIDQICAIYDSLVDERNWTYVDDWKGLDQFQYSNYTLRMGQNVGVLGIGDCDDFAILLGSLVESVGASSRIVFAYGPGGGHAYTEVYLGKANGPGSDVDRMMRYLRYVYKAEEINVHTDLATGDVWLNLDWWKEQGGAKHPGGPFFKAAKHVPVYPDKSEQKEPLTPVAVPPIAIFQVVPKEPSIGSNASFDASPSFDIEGNISSYQWDFGDGQYSVGKTAVHSYSRGGPMRVDLNVIDDQGLNGSNSTNIQVNQPPVAGFTFEPEHPMANEQIRFDASPSYDPDGRLLNYSWEFGNEGMQFGPVKVYTFFTFTERGTFNAKLTVIDDNGAQSTTNVPVIVSGAKITNAGIGDPASQFFDLMGEYSLSDSSKSIWVFVKPEEKNSRYYPQSLDSCSPHNASMQNGRWENRITLGGSSDAGRYFDIIVTLADENANQKLHSIMYEWWCPDYKGNRSDAGFQDLPDGVHETDRIRIIRSNESWNSSQNISNIRLPGKVNIVDLKRDTAPAYPNSNNATVTERVTVNGNRSNDARDQVWVLEHCLDGRWYPKSIDDENNGGHVTNIISLGPSSPDWHIDAIFKGKAGDPYEIVVVLANSSADDFFNRFQKSCAAAGNYTGLLTIALPPGIDEKDRIRVYRPDQRKSSGTAKAGRLG
jgi:PKD repeat protein